MNDTTFHGNGKVVNVPVIFGANPKPITNADRIRAMSDEELAAWLEDRTMLPINGLWLDWLKQEEET